MYPYSAVQLISLLAALHKKTGTKKDLKEIKERQAMIEAVSGPYTFHE